MTVEEPMAPYSGSEVVINNCTLIETFDKNNKLNGKYGMEIQSVD